MVKMNPKQQNQAGFIPLLILILMLVAAGVYLVYTRVVHAQSGV